MTDTNNIIVDRRNTMTEGCIMYPNYKYEKEYKPMKTNEEVYNEIRDKEEFITSKLLGKVQHSVYLDKRLFDIILKKSKEDDRSFNSMLVHLVRKGLEQDV
jgi:hypothetical protein